MRHLVIGQRQKAPNFSAFHWSPHSCLITIGQHFVTTRVVHLPKRTETSFITESHQSRANHQLLQLCTVRTAWSPPPPAYHHNTMEYLYLNLFLGSEFFLPTLHIRQVGQWNHESLSKSFCVNATAVNCIR